MFNLPYIAYGIFVLMLAINIFIGYKRGWKTALYVFGLIFVASGISIGISYGLYPVLRDPVGKMLKRVFHGDDQYDYTFLSDATKAHVLAFLISVLLVPITLLLWLITFTVWHFVKKMDAPLLTRRNSFNEKEVVFANSTKNKVISLSITTVSSILSASLVTSAITPIVTKSKSYNFFNTFTGGISRGLTFNQGYTDASTQMTYDIIPMTHDKDLMSGIQFVLKPGSSKSFNQSNIDSFNKSDNLARMTEILNRAKVYDVLSFINSGIGNDKSYWKPLGDDETNPTGYIYSVDKMKAIFESMNITLNSNGTNGLADWIHSEAIMPWEETDAYLNNKNAKEMLEKMEKAISNTQEQIKKLTTEAQEQKKKITEAITALSALHQKMIGSANVSSDSFTGMEGWKKLPDVVQADDKVRIQKEIERDAAQTALTKAESDLNQYKTSTFDPADSNYKQAKQETENAKSDSENAKNNLDENQRKINELNAAKSQVSTLTTQISSITNEINKLNTTLTSLQADLQTKNSAMTSAQNELKTAQNNYNQAKSRLDQVNADIQLKQQKKDDAVSAYNNYHSGTIIYTREELRLKTAKTNAENALRVAQADLSQASADESAAAQVLAAKKATHTNALQEANKAQQSVTSVTNDLQAKNSDKINLDNQKADAEKRVTDGQQAEGQKQAFEDAYQNANKTYASKKANESIAKTNFDKAQAELNKLNNIVSAKQADLNNKQTALTSAEEKLNAHKNLQVSIEAELKDRTEIAGIHQARKDAETRYQEIMRQDPFNSSNTTKVAENYVYNEEDWDADWANKKIVDNNINNLAQAINSISFKNSLEYLTNTNSNAQPVNTKVEPIKNSNESFSSKDIADIKSGTEGTLEVLKFNFEEYKKCQHALEIFMESQHKIFDSNIDEYLKMIKEVFSK